MRVYRATSVGGLSPEFELPSGVLPAPLPSPGAAPDGRPLRFIDVASGRASVVVELCDGDSVEAPSEQAVIATAASATTDTRAQSERPSSRFSRQSALSPMWAPLSTRTRLLWFGYARTYPNDALRNAPSRYHPFGQASSRRTQRGLDWGREGTDARDRRWQEEQWKETW